MRVRKIIYKDRESDGSARLVPRLELYIEDAPHRRMNVESTAQYRRALRAAFFRADLFPPICHPIELHAWFINPTSPDLDNLICALYRALDRYAPKGRNIGLLADDSLILSHAAHKMYVNNTVPAAEWRSAPELHLEAA